VDFYAAPWAYDLWFEGVNGDEEFWPELARRYGGQSILELGCGTGRLAIPLARELAEDGVRLVGLDLEPGMLDVARAALAAQPAEVRAAITLVEGDMRAFDLDQRFDVAFVAFNTLGHLHRIEDQLACFRAAHRHLVPGGRLAVELTFHSPESLAESVREGPLVLQGHSLNRRTGETTLFLHSTRYHPETQIREELLRLERVDHAGRSHVTDIELALHVYFPRELELLFSLAGFEVEAVYGDTDFGPLTEESEIQIVVGRAI
jgi:SAM-dependent methyltransferase